MCCIYVGNKLFFFVLLQAFITFIVLGIASDLHYLHEDCQRCVLHRDLKPSNIMLDSSFRARLSDFGLAMTVKHERSHATEYIAGTSRYINPTHIFSHNYNTSSDIFSFRVVVLAVVSGRRLRVINEDYSQMHIVDWVWRHYNKGKNHKCRGLTTEWSL